MKKHCRGCSHPTICDSHGCGRDEAQANKERCEKARADARNLQHCAIAVSDWLAGGCDVHDIPRQLIAALVEWTKVTTAEAAEHVAAERERCAEIGRAAQAVLDRWNSPKWEWRKQGPTADLMEALFKALKAQRKG